MYSETEYYLMQWYPWLRVFYWFICITTYSIALWICFKGKKKNPNRGWSFLIVAEILCLLMALPTFTILLHTSYYYVSEGVVLPIANILFLIGLYRIATK